MYFARIPSTIIILHFPFFLMASCSHYDPLLEDLVEEPISNDEPNIKCPTDAGLLDWVVRIGGKHDDREGGIALLSDGSFIFVGSFSDDATIGSTDGNEGYLSSPDEGGATLIARYTPEGVLLWAKREGVPLVAREGGSSVCCVASLPDDTFVVAGHYRDTMIFGKDEENETELSAYGPMLRPDMFVARYFNNGRLMWARRDGAELTEEPHAISAFDDGSVVVTGRFYGRPTFGEGEPTEVTLMAPDYDIFVARYSPDGTFAWARNAGGPAEQYGRDIFALPDGSSLVTGFYNAHTIFGPGEEKETALDSNGRDAFVAKYAADGDLEWVSDVRGDGLQSGHGVSAQPDGTFVITGQFGNNVRLGIGEANETFIEAPNGWHMYIAKYHADGRLDWARHAKGDSIRGLGISSFDDGSSVVLGHYYKTTVFGLGEPCETETYSPNPGRDVYIARYNEDGTFSWVRHVNGWGGEEYPSVIRALPDGSSIAAGQFYAGATFGPGEENETTLITPDESDWDIFVMRIGP